MRSEELIGRINALPRMDVKLMEVCGTHTMSIARAGIKRLLPEGVELLSGPGCPVCVTPGEVMDAALELTERREITLCAYGDMLRVPGTRRGD
ncbi:MAG TPA: hydrogenase formation protein HypD, partial [Candidatus Scatomorpha merdipullorum]|nr:hydrogenase formation protein HypD [Candidatus Scatomorpha merdipullorum]